MTMIQPMTPATRSCAGSAGKNPKIKAIFNARNFGQFNSPYYGMLQVTGDCVIEMVADFQDPVDMIPKVCEGLGRRATRSSSALRPAARKTRLCTGLRTFYYKIIKKLSEVEQIEHFTGSGLYDREFIEVLRKLDDPTPFLRGIVAELGYKRKEIPYEQPKRRAGKTHNNFYRLYDAAMLSVTSYTKAGLRLATFVGAISAFIKYGGCTGLSGNEADLVGPFPGRYGANAHWNAVSRLCPVIFHWFSG